MELLRAVLRCQALTVLPQALLYCQHNPKNLALRKIAWVVLIPDFCCADEEVAGEDSDGEHSPSLSADNQAGHLKGT